MEPKIVKSSLPRRGLRVKFIKVTKLIVESKIITCSSHIEFFKFNNQIQQVKVIMSRLPIQDLRVDMDPNARPGPISHDAYCQSSEEEARRKREPLDEWRSEPRAPEVEWATTADDVEPDVKPDVASSPPNALSRPSASSSTRESQQSPPDNKLWWGPRVVSSPTPQAQPPVSPNARESTYIRVPRAPRESSRQFDAAVSGLRRTRRRKMAAVILEDSTSSSSSDDMCALSDLSNLSI